MFNGFIIEPNFQANISYAFAILFMQFFFKTFTIKNLNSTRKSIISLFNILMISLFTVVMISLFTILMISLLTILMISLLTILMISIH